MLFAVKLLKLDMLQITVLHYEEITYMYNRKHFAFLNTFTPVDFSQMYILAPRSVLSP